MLGLEFLNQIEIIITDGDKPETSPLDIAIGLYFPHVMRLQCWWHIMDPDWLANGPKSTEVLKLKSSPTKMQSGYKRKNKSNKNWVNTLLFILSDGFMGPINRLSWPWSHGVFFLCCIFRLSE